MKIESAKDIGFEDNSSNRYPLYCTGRENVNYVFIQLELMKRQDFINMFFRAITCRSIFKSPISTDCIWYEIPIDRKKVETNDNSAKLVQDIVICQKRGYYLE